MSIISTAMGRTRLPPAETLEGIAQIRAALGYLLDRRGFRQGEVAAAVGKSRADLSKTLNGERPLYVKLLFEIAEAVGYEPGRLFVDLGRVLLAGDAAAGIVTMTPEGYLLAANADAALGALRQGAESVQRENERLEKQLSECRRGRLLGPDMSGAELDEMERLVRQRRVELSRTDTARSKDQSDKRTGRGR